MKIQIFLVVLLIGLMIFIGVPLGIYYVINQYKKSKYYNGWLLLTFCVVIVTAVLYPFYTSLYPDDEFYKYEFKEVTGVDFPGSAAIEYKSASFPDHFGDYASVAIIEVDDSIFKKLPLILMKKGLSENQNKIGSDEHDQAISRTEGKKIEKEFIKSEEGGFYHYVAFLSDKKTIIVERINW